MFTNESPFREAAGICIRPRAEPNTSEGRRGGGASGGPPQTWHPIMKRGEGGALAGRLAGDAESVCCASINPGVLPRSRSIANTKAHWWQTALDKHIAFFLSSIAIISKVTVSHSTAGWNARSSDESSLCLFTRGEGGEGASNKKKKKGPMHFKSALKALGTLLGSRTQGEWKHTYLTSGEADVTCHWLTAKPPRTRN